MITRFHVADVALTRELRAAAQIPGAGPAALWVIHQALTLHPTQTKALSVRYSRITDSDLHAALNRSQIAAPDPDVWEAVRREAWSHTFAAKLRHQAAHHLDDIPRFNTLWAPVWDQLAVCIPAAAVGLLCQEHITGADLLTLAGPWIELLDAQPPVA